MSFQIFQGFGIFCQNTCSVDRMRTNKLSKCHEDFDPIDFSLDKKKAERIFGRFECFFFASNMSV